MKNDSKEGNRSIFAHGGVYQETEAVMENEWVHPRKASPRRRYLKDLGEEHSRHSTEQASRASGGNKPIGSGKQYGKETMSEAGSGLEGLTGHSWGSWSL